MSSVKQALDGHKTVCITTADILVIDQSMGQVGTPNTN